MSLRSQRPRAYADPGLLIGAIQTSDVDLHGDLDGVVDFDAEVPHGALELGMSKQKLDGSEVARPPIDQHRLGAPQRVRSKVRRIKADTGHPRGQSRDWR